MDSNEFARVFNANYLEYYPDVKAWCASLPEATRAAWAALFAMQTPDDLTEAIQATVAGTDEPIAAYDRDRTATILLRRTRDVRDARLIRERSRSQQDAWRADERERDQRGGTLADGLADTLAAAGLGPALREINDRVDAGEDRDDVTAEIAAAVGRGER